MIQQILIGGLFLAALLYLSRAVYRSFTSSKTCDTGCSKCGALDLQKIESELKAKGF